MDLSKIYRTGSPDYRKLLDNIITAASDYLEHYGIHTVVLGLSGGIDSTLAAAIWNLVGKRTECTLIGISLPCSTNKDDEKTTARLAGQEFCDEYYEQSLESLFFTTEFTINQLGSKGDALLKSTPISQGNIKARLRMLYLYNIASIRGGIVADTDNLPEHFLGFYTLHGDQGDYSLTSALWKHEIYGLAKFIQENFTFGRNEYSIALKQSIGLTPTDGNGVKEGGDLAQIAPGATYDIVDDILMRYIYTESQYQDGTTERDEAVSKCLDRCKELYDEETTSRVIHRYLNSKFKRYHGPVFVDAFTGTTIDWNSKTIVDGRNVTNKE